MRTPTLAAVAALVAAPAFAAGLAEPIAEPVLPAPAPVPIVAANDWTGGYVGAQLGYGDVSGNLSGDDWLGGVHAGYMHDFGGWVLGGELDHDIADISLGGGDSLDGITRLKLRAGAGFGRTLVYATVGAASASADIGGASLRDTGWLGGFGLGYQVSDNWVVGGEVLGHRFENFDGSGLDFDTTTATLRASFRF